MTKPHLVHTTGIVPFGGSRVDGLVQTIVWNDGVIIATAWSETDPVLKGEIVCERYTVTRSPSYQSTVDWTLRDVTGEYRGTFPTRKAAAAEADRRVRLSLFRRLNALAGPAVHTVRGLPIPPEGLPYGTTHDMNCPGCAGTPFLASPRSETYWSS